MTIVGISGWLQPADALNGIMPGIKPFRYDHLDKRQCMQGLAELNPEVVIAWSLGGVLAVQALMHPQYRPRKLILIAAPFQFLASQDFPDGMLLEDYEAFRRDYIDNPKSAARRLQLLSNYGLAEDTPLCPLADNAEETKLWLPWLEHLAATNFSRSKYAHQPEVLLVQGGKDAICAPGQSKHWARIFPWAQVLMLPRSAHAPHMQDTVMLRRTVAEFLNDIQANTQAAFG